jgi:hypothetical protein
MKSLLSLLAAVGLPLAALGHGHLEIGLASGDHLAVAGNFSQTATYFPLGEAPSTFLPVFPGGAFASELTFRSDGDALGLPTPGRIRAEILAVTGPAGGAFSFWEANASSPTVTRSTGWTATPTDTPSFAVSEDGTGYGHIHGRVFTLSKAGTYQVTFRAVDATGGFAPSAPFVVTFTAIEPPQLGVRVVGDAVELSFPSRDFLTYDVQVSETLAVGSWVTVDTLDGTGGILQHTESLGSRKRVFFRLVEYP